MKPKKFKTLIEGIAEEVGVHENVVTDFIKFYYSEVRKHMVSVTDPKIYIDNLGTFSVMKKKLNKALEKQRKILKNVDLDTYNGYEKHLNVSSKKKIMERNLDVMGQRRKEYQEFKSKK